MLAPPFAIDVAAQGWILAEWDISGLNGLYALQLLVVHSDNSITTAAVMVTIKN